MVVQIPIMDEIFIGYYIVGLVSTMISSLMYNSKFMMGDMIFRRVLMVTCDMLLRDHLRNTSSISLLGSGRVRVGDIGDALLQLWYFLFPYPGPTRFSRYLCLIEIERIGHHFGT